MVWVFLGGLLGAPARYLLEAALPSTDSGFPVPTFVVNALGALALGLLLESLVLAGGFDTGVCRRLRLFLGIGFLGTFTTYSSFAVEIELLLRGDRMSLAAGYAAASLAAGLAAVALGIWAAQQLRRRRGDAR